MTKFSDNSMAGIFWDELQLALGTLGAGTTIQINSRLDSSRLQGFKLLRTEYDVQVFGLTAAEGPVHVSLCHDLTTTEHEETLGGDPQRAKDPDLSEKAMRPVWPLGHLYHEGGIGVTSLRGVIKLGWSFPEGTPMKWCFNNRFGTSLTTGAQVRLTAKHFGVWLRD